MCKCISFCDENFSFEENDKENPKKGKASGKPLWKGWDETDKNHLEKCTKERLRVGDCNGWTCNASNSAILSHV